MVRYSFDGDFDSSPESSDASTHVAVDHDGTPPALMTDFDAVAPSNGSAVTGDASTNTHQDAVRRAVAEFHRKLAESDAANDAANNRKKQEDRQKLLDELNQVLINTLCMDDKNSSAVFAEATGELDHQTVDRTLVWSFMSDICEELGVNSNDDIDSMPEENLKHLVSACTKKRLWDNDVCPEFFKPRAVSNMRMLVAQTPTELKRHFLKLLFFGDSDELLKYAALLDHLEDAGILLWTGQRPDTVVQLNEWFDTYKDNVSELYQAKKNKHLKK